MAILKKWSAFFNRTDLTTNDDFQVVGIDLSNATPANRNQRTPITQLLRSGKNLSDLASVSTAVTNLGATSASIANSLVKRDSSGFFNASGVVIDAANAPAVNIGATATFNLGIATASNNFFTGTVNGDVCIRQTNTARQLLLGVGGANAQFSVQNTVILSNIAHRFTAVGANRMPFTDANTALIGSANYTVNGSGALTIAGLFTSAGANFTANVNVTATNQSYNLGSSQTVTLAKVSSVNSFFTGTAANDGVLRLDNTGASLFIGVGAATAQLIISNTQIVSNTQILLGTSTPDASSIFTVNSTTQGLLPPRMTTTQKNAISSPTSGLIVYDTTLGKLCVRGAAAWETITSI